MIRRLGSPVYAEKLPSQHRLRFLGIIDAVVVPAVPICAIIFLGISTLAFFGINVSALAAEAGNTASPELDLLDARLFAPVDNSSLNSMGRRRFRSSLAELDKAIQASFASLRANLTATEPLISLLRSSDEKDRRTQMTDFQSERSGIGAFASDRQRAESSRAPNSSSSSGSSTGSLSGSPGSQPASGPGSNPASSTALGTSPSAGSSTSTPLSTLITTGGFPQGVISGILNEFPENKSPSTSGILNQPTSPFTFNPTGF